MSRLEFRSSLETPRPRSAVVLVALATASLAVSGQVSGAVLGLQAAALAFAAWPRRAPQGWQLRGFVLNAGLVAAALFALMEALRGAPTALALAHLAILASGLQLLDARPRRSEFLLVALALFQVVLASSLTDSLLFPPLLIAFLPTCVWTLLVHTLRSEALEAGDPAAASDVLTPGLLGMTLVASSVSLVLALGLFFLLPRLHDGLLRTGGSEMRARAGFSDRVELGDLGKIRSDPAVMLRVETVEGEAPAAGDAYFRGLAFDRFDGRSWSMSAPERRPVEGEPARGLPLSARGGEPDLVQRILREPVASGVLFGAGEALTLEGGTGRIERDANGGLYAPQTADQRVRYRLGVRSSQPDEDALAADRALPPRGAERYLSLPPLDPRIEVLGHRIVGDETRDIARARALEAWLRRNGRYSDTPPPEVPGDPHSPLERFLLGERAGHCEYFASAMVVLARSQGLPARLVNGFAGGRRNRVGGFVELTGSDAHAWVEIHFERHGWVRFDPTPPDQRLAALGDPTLRDRLEELRSALELFWFQHVVEFDRTQQVGAAIGAWRTLRALLPRADGAASEPSGNDWLARLRALPAGDLALLAAALLALAFLWRARRGDGRQEPTPRTYAAALRLLARHGHVRPAALTPRGFARDLARRLTPRGADAFTRLTEIHLARRWGGAAGPDGDEELRTLRDSLRA